MKRLSIFLISAAVITGMTACAAPPAEYDLTISSTAGGSVTIPGEGTFIYNEGTVVNLVATPDAGYRFVKWTGDVDDIISVEDATATVTVNDNYSITANFIAQYVLTIDSTDGGEVTTPGEGTFTYDAGAVVDLVTEAEEDYGFAKWTGDVDSIGDVNGASTTVAMNGDYTISANFGVGIYDWYDLDAVREKLGGRYILMNNLDSTTAGYAELASPTANGGKGWLPIGHGYWDWDGEQGQWVGEFLEGGFYGQGYEIRDLYIDRPDEDGVGLFSLVARAGTIEDVRVMDAVVTGCETVGGLVGWNDGTVRNSYYGGSVAGERLVGGLVGQLWTGTVSNSYASGSTDGTRQVGGLVGAIDSGTVSNSYYSCDEVLVNGESIIATGALYNEDFEQWLANDKFLDVNERLSQDDGYYLINDVSDFKLLLAFGQDSSLKFRLTSDLDLAAEPDFYIPYLAGEFDGNGHKVLNLSFSFDFVAHVGLFGYVAPGVTIDHLGVVNTMTTGDYTVGALVGWNYGNVSNSYSTGSVTGGGHVGGLVGFHGGTMSNSYSTGSVASGGDVGGLVGRNEGTVSNSYSTGSVTGHVTAGGLVGYNWKDGIVSNSYSTGSVGGDEHVGGLVGWSNGIVRNSLWDTQTSGQATSAGGTGKTTAEMKNVTTFSGAGWNIIAVADPGVRIPSYIWNIVNGQTYPFLSWQPVS